MFAQPAAGPGKLHRCSRTGYRLATIAAVVLASAVLLRAQTTATIVGVVHDTQGQPIYRAAVNVLGQKTGAKRNFITDKAGAFRFAELPPDTYQVSATCDACNDASNIVDIGAGQARSVELELDTTSSSSIILLDTHATTLDGTSSRIGMNVTATEIAELPVNGRTFAPLALTAPFVSNAGGASFSDLRFSGQSSQQDRYTLDNVDASSVMIAQPGFVPLAGYEFRLRNSLNTVDEFRVDSAGYSVEDGFATGGQIKLVSKAGSNGWHGSVFGYLRDDDLQARNFFDTADVAELRMHQTGASGGGNIFRDKVFVFGSFEQLTQRAGLQIFETVPSLIARRSAVPSILPALTAIPPGFAATNDPDIAQAERETLAIQDESNGSARIDYVPSSRHRLFVRYSRSSGNLSAPDYSTTSRSIISASKPDQMVASWTFQITGSEINQLTAGINRAPGNASVTSGSSTLDGSRILIGDQSVGAIASPGNQMRLVGGSYGSVADYRGRTYNLRDAIDWSAGTHSIQAGVEWQAARMPFTTVGGLTYSFRDDNSFLADQDADVTYVQSLPWREAERENYAGYVQDQRRLNGQVQLVLGLRYEYFGATREAQNAAAVFDYRTFSFHEPNGAFYQASKLGFEPRFAITWTPQRLGGDTVFRLGAGIYSGPNAFLNTLSPIFNSVSKLFLGGGTFPMTEQKMLASPAVISQPSALDPGTFGLPQRNAVLTASIQQVLPHRFVGEIAYNGILSRHLTQEGFANLATGEDPIYGETLRPARAFSAVPYLMNGGTSSYNALALRLNRHLVDNLTVTAAYTLSHSIGDTQGTGDQQIGQDPQCLACERSDNNFDIRQEFALTSVYSLPLGKGHPHLNSGFWGALLGNWTAAGILNQRTGLPVNVLINRSDEIYYSPASGLYYSPSSRRPSDAIAVVNAPGGLEGYGAFRPNVVAGVDAYERNGVQWLNPSAFSVPAPGKTGNLGRNSLRGPGFTQLDVQLSRSFTFSDRFRLTAKAEGFNLFNHANFSNPALVLADVTTDAQPGTAYNSSLAPGFGLINSTVGRTVGLGTSRQIQLGLRFEF